MINDFIKDNYAMLDRGQKDTLTNFFLRDSLDPFLDQVIHDAQAQKRDFSIAVLDVDRFKKFNDKFGHLFGDDVLKYIASTLRLTLKDAAYVFRYGGDEFVIVFPDKDIGSAFELMRRCNYSVANRPFSYKGKLVLITVSCGIASFPRDAKTKQLLLKRADEALYFSKRYGRNSTVMARKMKYIKFRIVFFYVAGICIVLFSLFILARYIFREHLQKTIDKVKRIKVIEEAPKDLDIITLKRGKEIKGYIVEEKDGKLVVNLDLEQGKGSFVIDRSEIAHIEYGSKKPSP